ncbi:DUF72 domain-containing protein [Caulobacter sp. 17J80-11]|uniref:DUF72 domain-containing protein n=1 Tax=Caulobacter sp. 17J80-11 TaxID=2763502 RepID=UPI001653EA5A|nr:DUF72 domain-containing protein [Caulobacter sp. 17J80-11]MBC6980259.1 DUF72 domain-containing protein [Caulobacter sp. 17J80-11]
MADLRVGTSGWTYKDWIGPFYPEGTKAAGLLAWYASRFDTTEINASFYRVPSEKAVATWRERTPEGFLFAWKASRFITHTKRLKDVGESLGFIFGRMDGLGDRFGPVLFQLPPNLKRDDERLAGFLALLPKGRRCVVEFRHPSWYEAAVFELLRAHDAALCVSDHHHAPAPWEATASFVYVRGHGSSGRYVGSYADETLTDWARRLKAWRKRGLDAYVYFDNDVKSAAPKDAERLLNHMDSRAKTAVRSSLRQRSGL